MQQPFSLPKEPLPTTWHCPIIFVISSVDLRSEECFLNLKRNLEKEEELFQIRNSMGWWSRKQSSQGESGEERLPWLSKGSLEACEGAHCHLPPFLFLHGEWFSGSTSQACSENITSVKMPIAPSGPSMCFNRHWWNVDVPFSKGSLRQQAHWLSISLQHGQRNRTP